MGNPRYIKALYWLGVVAWLSILYVTGHVADLSAAQTLAKPGSYVLPFLLLVAAVFQKWGWRFKYLYPWFVSEPNIIGTYKGTIRSSWINPETGESIAPIPAFLVVTQSLGFIHIRLHTQESSSFSLVGFFDRAQDGTQALIYTYQNKPRAEVRYRSEIHYGGAQLMVGEKNTRLHGDYWTDRKTIGEMDFRRFSKIRCTTFEECETVHSLGENPSFIQRIGSRSRGKVRARS